MQDPSPKENGRRSGFIARIERAAGDMNAFLFMLAIGLAALDLSCFWAMKLRDALPAVQPAAATAPVAPLGFGGGFAAAQPQGGDQSGAGDARRGATAPAP